MWMKIAKKWRKARISLARNLCADAQEKIENTALTLNEADRLFDLVSGSSSVPCIDQESASEAASSSSSFQSSKRTCAICLTTLRPGKVHAIFTAECSHDFHFDCIASNVKHGNLICPVCRAKWKEVPCRTRDRLHVKDDHNCPSSVSSPTEPSIFDDDEALCGNTEISVSTQRIEVKVYPEVSAIAESASVDEFDILVNLKAPLLKNGCSHRAPVDLVTVLDISGSMAGTKLALLKRAMSFVIQNLGGSDRLSVVAFSSSARRLIPLRRMTESGRRRAMVAVGSLVSNGGTNIAEGLKKGAKVMADRRARNPVSSMILLSDGQDTYTYTRPYAGSVTSTAGIPVHSFGFGSDHDPDTMHSVSESSGGMFSFIESECAIQDAFAQCIGGLLSVVAQKIVIRTEVSRPQVKLVSLKAGGYKTTLSGQVSGSVDARDLYAGEERDFYDQEEVHCFTLFSDFPDVPEDEWSTPSVHAPNLKWGKMKLKVGHTGGVRMSNRLK